MCRTNYNTACMKSSHIRATHSLAVRPYVLCVTKLWKDLKKTAQCPTPPHRSLYGCLQIKNRISKNKIVSKEKREGFWRIAIYPAGGIFKNIDTHTQTHTYTYIHRLICIMIYKISAQIVSTGPDLIKNISKFVFHQNLTVNFFHDSNILCIRK